MDGHTKTRLAGVVAAFCLGALGIAGSAAALAPPDPTGDPKPPPRPVPNLIVSNASAAFHDTGWELQYTVANRGTGPAPAFRVDLLRGGSTLLRSVSEPSLAAHTSRTEVVVVPSSLGCYLPVRFVADAGRTVQETNEFDNDRWAVGEQSPFCPTQPKYRVKAVSFHANDETGIDFLGSDEVYWIFNGVGMSGTAVSSASHTFGDVDTGDTMYFGESEGCLYRSCDGGAAPNGIGLSVQAWEQDLGYTNDTLTRTADEFHMLGGVLEPTDYILVTWMAKVANGIGDVVAYLNSLAADDLIGSQTFGWSPVELAQRLPAVDTSFTDTRVYNESGEYTMTVQVTRVG